MKNDFQRKLILIGVWSSLTMSTGAWAQRFLPQDINAPADSFMQEVDVQSINVQFLVADILGKTSREVRRETDEQLEVNQELIEAELAERLEENGVRAVSDSILISPGADINELTIIDFGQDTPIAIDR